MSVEEVIFDIVVLSVIVILTWFYIKRGAGSC